MVRRVSGFVIPFSALLVGCQDATPPRAAALRAVPSAVALGCASTEVAVHEIRGGATFEACALPATVADLVDETSPRRFQEAPNLKDGVLDALVLVRGEHFLRGPTRQTLMACGEDPKKDDNCCNRCDGAILLSGFGAIPVYSWDRVAAGCGGGCCERPKCPEWLPSEQAAVDVVGRFHSGFDPEGLRSGKLRELLPALYFQLADAPRAP
ncbi:MAG TPA: hypothetical protein VHE30_30605 [Polyangiaceae bacterium]|nr:hypothetical protein [Polyangiaceae bacterium]